MADDWRVMVAETVTGTIMADINPRDLPTFTRKINDKGSWTINVVPDDNADVDLQSYVTAGRYSWVIMYGSTVVQAGPTFTYTYTESTRTLSVSGAGIQGLLDRRVLRNPAGTIAIVDPSQDLTMTGSLRDIARQIVAADLTQTGYGLPIDLPAAEAGTNTRTYFGYDLATVWGRLDELSKVDQGPELDFAPYLVSGANQIRWQLHTGGPLLGDQASAAVWDYGGALYSIDVDSNGSASPCTRAWVKGSGSERALLTGFAENDALISEGFPPTDYVDGNHTSVIDQDTLESYADADLTQLAAAVDTYKCIVRIDGTGAGGRIISPTLGTWSLGDQATFGVSGHPWVPDGQYRRRITGYANDTYATVSLELQPAVS